MSQCVCLCVSVGKPEHHCAAATTGPPSPPTRHNKEQLNAAALPAEEPTASHTSTNRQICLKPKERSNKSQPTESNPLRSPSLWFKPEGDWLASPYHSLSQFRRHYHQIHAKLNPCNDLLHMVSAYRLYRPGRWKSTRAASEELVMCWNEASFRTWLFFVLQGFKMWKMSSDGQGLFLSMTGYSSTGCVHGIALCLFDLPEILLRIKAFSSPH